jgi:sugar (pentulose or hexulose) kinase
MLNEPVLNETHGRLLQALLAGAGATAGVLFALYDGQPQLLAAKPAALAQEPLYADELKRAVAKELECSGGTSTPDAATGLRVQVAETAYQLHWLRDHETQRVVAACLVRAHENGQGPQPRQLDPRLLAETASSLLLAAFGVRAR